MVYLNHALVCVEEGWQPKKHFLCIVARCYIEEQKMYQSLRYFQFFNSNKYLKGQRRVCEHTCIQMCVPNT